MRISLVLFSDVVIDKAYRWRIPIHGWLTLRKTGGDVATEQKTKTFFWILGFKVGAVSGGCTEATLSCTIFRNVTAI